MPSNLNDNRIKEKTIVRDKAEDLFLNSKDYFLFTSVQMIKKCFKNQSNKLKKNC